jgi:hypothetical protein
MDKQALTFYGTAYSFNLHELSPEDAGDPIICRRS